MIILDIHRWKIRNCREYATGIIARSKVARTIASAAFTVALLSSQSGMFDCGPIGNALAQLVLVTDRNEISLHDRSIQQFSLAGNRLVDGHPQLVGPRVALSDDPDRASPKLETGSRILVGGRASARPLAASPSSSSSDRPPAETAPFVGGFCPWVPQPSC